MRHPLSNKYVPDILSAKDWVCLKKSEAFVQFRLKAGDIDYMKLDFGPLRSLFESEEISEIMINQWNKIFVEHNGQLVETSVRFVDQRQLEELIFSILASDKKSLDSSYCFDGMLPSGERYNITLPPMSNKGPTLTIRKFFKKTLSLDDLVSKNFLTQNCALFLKSAVEKKLNIVISGGTGTGKTSLLNTLTNLIPKTERIVSIEDVPEIQTTHPNWISLVQVQNKNMKISLKDCLHNSLRMRPDRIIVGECRKNEVFEMLQAMNSGHEGSMTSLHANSASECLSRIETLMQLTEANFSTKVLRTLISKSLNLIIQLKRRSDGAREISEVIEITGMENETITKATVFEISHGTGILQATGYIPNCLKKINSSHQIINHSVFDVPFKQKKII